MTGTGMLSRVGQGLVVLGLVALCACQFTLPGRSGGAPNPTATAAAAQSPITGGPISVKPVTPAGAPAVAKPEGAAPVAPAPARKAQPEAQAAPAAAPVAPRSEAQLRCEARGGVWSRAGGEASFACVRRTRDAGRSCRKESDCEGFCLARSGTCAPVTPMFGCNDILQKDGRRVTLCLE